MFFDLLNAECNEMSSPNFLQQLGIMHLAATIGTTADCDSDIGLSTFYNSIREVKRCAIKNAGLPADWAFTICKLFRLVHFDLIRKRRYEDAALLFNFIWKAYAYKLKEAKRIAFMANFFAGLHYDYSPHNKLNMIKKMGTYILRKFSGTPYRYVWEYCVYVTVVWLCMADIQKQETRDDQYLSVILQAEMERFSPRANLGSVWNCILYYSELICGNTSYHNYYDTLIDEIFHEGCRVAFDLHRFQTPESDIDLRVPKFFTRRYSGRFQNLISVPRIRFDIYRFCPEFFFNVEKYGYCPEFHIRFRDPM